MWSSWKMAAKARLVGAGLALMLMAGAAAPSMAQEGFSADLGVMRACGGDIWSLCSDVLPDVLRVKSCVANKMGQLSKGCLDKLLDVMAGAQFKVCKDQTYALCAAARCNVLDGVAYCQCDVKHGDSISLPFPMGRDEDVCSINAAGAANKYMISTYSLPEAIVAPSGDQAIYTCPGESSDGAYAQCDGGILLQKHRGDDVPRLRQARAERPDRLFLPHNPGQSRHHRARLFNPRALPLRQVLLQVLQERHRQQQDGFDDLCRRPSWHGPGSGCPAQRQSPAGQ